MLHTVRLQSERAPHPRDRGLREPRPGRHLPRGPVRTPIRRSALQRLDDHVLHAIIRNRPRAPWPRLVHQPIQPRSNEPPPPLTDRRRAHTKPRSDLLIRNTTSALQHDRRAQRQPLRGTPPTSPPLKLPTLTIGELQHRLGTTKSSSHPGTLPYLPPELTTQDTSQALRRRRLDHRHGTDIQLTPRVHLPKAARSPPRQARGHARTATRHLPSIFGSLALGVGDSALRLSV